MDGVLGGDTNALIAEMLETTEQVIKNYLRVIYDKAGVDTRLELALWWLEHGYTSKHARTERDVANDRREAANRRWGKTRERNAKSVELKDARKKGESLWNHFSH